MQLLASLVEHGTTKPDPPRLQRLCDLASPHHPKSMKRTFDLHSHYSKYIPRFSDKISISVKTKTFPFCVEAEKTFHDLKKEIENPLTQSIDELLPFELKCDAFNIAIAAVLNPASRPVAFFSKTLYGSELKWQPIQKETCAIIEAIRNWKHYLTGCSFGLITDQKSVLFMLNPQNKRKIKNEKIYR